MIRRKRNTAADAKALVDVAIDAERSVRLLSSEGSGYIGYPPRVQLVRTATGELLLDIPLHDATTSSVRVAVGAIMRLRARFAAPVAPDATAAPLSPLEAAMLDANALRAFVGRWDGPAAFGLLPLRADRHPDGSLRLVWVRVAVPDGFLEPLGPRERRGETGHLYQSALPPGFVEAHAAQETWWTVKVGQLDASPEWREVASYRTRPLPDDPRAAKTLHETLDNAEERSGYKQPAKLREVRQQHWRNVAFYLWRRFPVAPEVMASYPDLATFYATDMVAAQTFAEKRVELEVLDNPENPDVTVEWSAESGLLIHTRGKVDAIITAIRGLRSARFKWSRTMGCYYRPQSVGVSESTVDIDRVAGELRAAGLTVAVDRGEVGSLGDANARRQEHKFWRAERYAQRGEAALEKATGFEERAGSIRSDLPVGAPTKRAERAEERAERAEAKAGDELAYAGHAASVSENLARTAAGYETTATLTRREAEKRADAFAALFVHKVKGAVGASQLRSDKTDNLSAYSLSWVILYPPAAGVMGMVRYDGRVIEVATHATTEVVERNEYLSVHRLTAAAVGGRNAYREDVTALDAPAIYERVVQALPKFVAAPATARIPATARELVTDLAQYATRRAAKVSAAAGRTVQFRAYTHKGDDRTASIDYFGQWSYELHYKMRQVDGLRFRFALVKDSGSYGAKEEERFATDAVDFAGLSIEEAFELFLAGTRALFTQTPLVAPAARKVPRPRAAGASRATAPERSGVSGVDARDAAAGAAQARREALGEASSAVAAQASARLRSLQATAEAVSSHEQAIDRARGEGHTAGFYPTPPTLARAMADAVAVQPGERVLEPSAGMGALVEELVSRGAAVDAAEFSEARRAYLRAAFAGRANILDAEDFLVMPPVPFYDAVVMNPPFAVEGMRQADAVHVEHALRFLRPGGRLVALMSPGSVDASTGRRRAALHAALQGFGVQWVPVEAGRFRISGTDTPTVMLVASAPKANRRG